MNLNGKDVNAEVLILADRQAGSDAWGGETKSWHIWTRNNIFSARSFFLRRRRGGHMRVCARQKRTILNHVLEMKRAFATAAPSPQVLGVAMARIWKVSLKKWSPRQSEFNYFEVHFTIFWNAYSEADPVFFIIAWRVWHHWTCMLLAGHLQVTFALLEAVSCHVPPPPFRRNRAGGIVFCKHAFVHSIMTKTHFILSGIWGFSVAEGPFGQKSMVQHFALHRRCYSRFWRASFVLSFALDFVILDRNLPFLNQLWNLQVDDKSTRNDNIFAIFRGRAISDVRVSGAFSFQE